METTAKDAMIVEVTKKWIRTVVAAQDFCPFVQKEMERDSIRYRVLGAITAEECRSAFADELRDMNSDDTIETTLLILASGYEDFEEYLMLVGVAEAYLECEELDGTYQLASFHPDYCFVEASQDDAANYTNRSPYPMIHILRSSSVEEAVVQHTDPEGIPARNIERARRMGAEALKELREQCWLDDAGNHVDPAV